ncbi:MAG: hypothetical protein KC425_02490, partial [Anaerolineales bacterium]|nr:hypothetical protein [Anaerolineales bacterium]
LQAAPPPPPPPPPPAATLTVNFLGGKPGSTFGFSGTNFEEGQAVAIYINGYSAGTVTADNDGDIAFGIDTDLATVAGAHYVFATGGDQQADAVFFVSADAPSLPPPGVSPIFGVPAGSGHPLHIWLPVGFQE